MAESRMMTIDGSSTGEIVPLLPGERSAHRQH
jgi:hypothetical protein